MGDRRSFLKTALLAALLLPAGRLRAALRRRRGGTVLVDGWILTPADLRALGGDA